MRRTLFSERKTTKYDSGTMDSWRRVMMSTIAAAWKGRRMLVTTFPQLRRVHIPVPVPVRALALALALVLKESNEMSCTYVRYGTVRYAPPLQRKKFRVFFFFSSMKFILFKPEQQERGIERSIPIAWLDFLGMANAPRQKTPKQTAATIIAPYRTEPYRTVPYRRTIQYRQEKQ